MTNAPINVYPHYPLPRAAQGKTRGFDIFHIKCLYLRAEFLIKYPLGYFRDSTVNITTDLWLSHHSLIRLKPTQVEWGHVKCPTLLIDPLVKAPHRPRRRIVGDLIDKCITLIMFSVTINKFNNSTYTVRTQLRS